MDRVRDRSSLALERVVRRFEDRVRGVGRRFDLPPSDLDELFQEIRIRLWKALDDPERIDALSGSYVYKTATSAAVDLIRRRRTGGNQVPLDPNLQAANPTNPARQQEAREAGEEVSRALQRLGARRRPVVRMYLAGYSHKEIAEVLGWSPGSTRNLLYRGLSDLRADLSDRWEGLHQADPFIKWEETTRVNFPSPDSTQDLRAAYQLFLARRGSPDNSSCPDPDELLALVESRSAEEDRLRVLDHVAQCSRCRREFDLLRAVADAQPTRTFQVRSWMAAAASVAILFGAGYGVWRGVGRGGDAVLRGPESSVELVKPAAGEVGPGEVEFQWRSSEDAFEYVFEILDPEGQSLFTRVTTETSFLLDLDEHPAFERGVGWWVRARLRDGTERTSETRGIELPSP